MKITATDEVMAAVWSCLSEEHKRNLLQTIYGKRLTKEMSAFSKTTWLDGAKKFPGLAYDIKRHSAVVISPPVMKQSTLQA